MDGKREDTRNILHGYEVASYDLLLWYTDKVLETTLGSIVMVDRDGKRFRRAFVIFWLPCFSSSFDRDGKQFRNAFFFLAFVLMLLVSRGAIGRCCLLMEHTCLGNTVVSC